MNYKIFLYIIHLCTCSAYHLYYELKSYSKEYATAYKFKHHILILILKIEAMKMIIEKMNVGIILY